MKKLRTVSALLLMILAVCVAALLSAVMIGQAVTRADPDYTLLLVTEKAYSAKAVAYFENALPDDADPSAIAQQKEVLALLTAYAAQ